MKMAGFIRRLDDGIISKVVDYDRLNENAVTIEQPVMDNVLSYLAMGKMIFAITLALEDTDGSYIGPYALYTDGEWIWPEYYSYFIRTGQVTTMPKDFLDQMSVNHFAVPPVEPAKGKAAEAIFGNCCGKMIPSLTKNDQGGNDAGAAGGPPLRILRHGIVYMHELWSGDIF
jgi:hypothetical protein